MHPYLAILLATLVWGVWGFAHKNAVTRAHPYTVQWMYSIPYALAIPLWYWLSMRVEGSGVAVAARPWLWSTMGSVASISAVFLVLVAMRTTSASVAVALTSTYPLITLLLGTLNGSERVTTVKVLGIVLIAVGVMLLRDP